MRGAAGESVVGASVGVVAVVGASVGVAAMVAEGAAAENCFSWYLMKRSSKSGQVRRTTVVWLVAGFVRGIAFSQTRLAEVLMMSSRIVMRFSSRVKPSPNSGVGRWRR